MSGNTAFKVVVVIAAIMMCVCACGAPTKRKSNAPNIPPGTYQKSCYGCNIIKEDGAKLLSCECSMTCGSLNPTKIVLDDSCKAFGNRNGVLFCDKDMENDDNIPKGPYADNCGGCSYDEKTRILNCKRCRNLKNEFVETFLQIPETDCTIALHNGKLACVETVADTMKDANAKNPEKELEKKEL